MGHTKRKQNPQLKSRQTRSSRGRLLSLSDPAQTAQQLDDQLRQLGLYAAPTLGDGNCLFRALSDQLYGTDSKHSQLRQDICDWIQKHRTRYEPFVDDERGIETHIRCMRENATYGGHMELSAFAHMAKRNVKVVQPGLIYVIEWDAFATSSSSPPPSPDKEANHPDQENSSPVYVAYHDWEHFSSIRNLKGPHVGLPVVKERPAPSPDLTPAVTEEYKPSKDKKKAEKEKERERKEKKKEKAREKLTKGKAEQKSADPTPHQYPDHNQELGSATEPELEQEPEQQHEGNEPEKLKITLKLRLNSNPSSANISESESKSSTPAPTTTTTKLTKTGSGLKLRLPPSRSLSATPSASATPPVSQASSSNNSSISSSTINLSTTSSSTSFTTTTTSTTASSTPTSTIHHVQPPTHTSAPHLNDESINIDHNGIHRTNRSPKRTFEESEISEDNVHSSGSGSSGGPRVRSRLCGPDREPFDSGSAFLDKEKEMVGDVEMLEIEADADAETDVGGSVKRILSPIKQEVEGEGEGEGEGIYSDSDILSSLSSSPSSPSSPKEKQASPSPPPLPSTTQTSTSHHHHTSNIKRIQIPNKSSVPAGQGRSNAIRQSKRELALGVAAGMVVNNNGFINGTSNTSINNSLNQNGKPLTRRERKKLGLPKVRTVMPYSRGNSTRIPRINGSGGGGRGGVRGKDGGGGESGDEKEEEEWLRNGTGRVDVRGFRELRI